jgi:hypothetical protein
MHSIRGRIRTDSFLSLALPNRPPNYLRPEIGDQLGDIVLDTDSRPFAPARHLILVWPLLGEGDQNLSYFLIVFMGSGLGFEIGQELLGSHRLAHTCIGSDQRKDINVVRFGLAFDHGHRDIRNADPFVYDRRQKTDRADVDLDRFTQYPTVYNGRTGADYREGIH